MRESRDASVGPAKDELLDPLTCSDLFPIVGEPGADPLGAGMMEMGEGQAGAETSAPSQGRKVKPDSRAESPTTTASWVEQVLQQEIPVSQVLRDCCCCCRCCC